MKTRGAPVALLAAANYDEPALQSAIFKVLDAAQINIGYGMRVLVKPNMLLANELACANARVVLAVCQWLLQRGALVEVSDSPGFGRVEYVARSIGLDKLLRPLGVPILPMDEPVGVALPLPDGKVIRTAISRRALESDMIFSVARVKAHSQMRVTLSVKNCFGCVPGLRKAVLHARFGRTHEIFAAVIAAVWAKLPPCAGVVDGIVAMHITGPSKGKPFRLGLLGGSASAPALDNAIMEILGVGKELVPLAMALEKQHCPVEAAFPLLNPHDFRAAGFVFPDVLKSASFNPLRLAVSLARRLWKSRLR